MNKADELAKAAKEASEEAKKAAETAGKMSQSASERAEEAARGAKSLAAEAVKKAEAMATKMEKSHQEMAAEVKHLSTKVEDALRTANEALERVKDLAGRLLTQWESVIVILAITGAAAMLGLGLALFMNP